MYYIGIDLGGTNIAIGIVDENYKIVMKDKVPTRAERSPEAVIADMAALCRDLMKRTGIGLNEIISAGIASPGTVDPENGIVKYSNNLKMFQFPIAETLRQHIPFSKIYLENDANAAAKGEAEAGAAKGSKNSILITLGTGLGGGVILDGRVYSGFNHAGAEFGHTVIEYGGKSCTCGRRGCWESYSSATGLIRMTREKLEQTKDTMMWDMVGRDINAVSGRTAFAAMKQGDQAGREVVDLYISYLACGIVNMINIFQPEVFSIGGGISGEKEHLLNPLATIVDRDQYGSHAREKEEKTILKIAELGNDAGIVGAALLGL